MDPNAPSQISDDSSETAAPASKLPTFNVGDRVHNPTIGHNGEVFGVSLTPDGEFLLFSAEGRWIRADGFALVVEDPAPTEDPAPPAA